MKRKLLSVALLCILGVGAVTACNSDEYSIEITNKESVSAEWHVKDANRNLGVSITINGEEQNASAAITSGELSVTSSNPTAIGASGLSLRALSAGSGTVTAEYHGQKDSVDITVLPEVVGAHDWELGTEYYLGFDVNGTNYYITGETVSGYSYEGAVTTDPDKAIAVTLSEGEETNGYYMTFELSGVTYYICIIAVNGYQDLQYTTEKEMIYWDADNGVFCNADKSYFLCYNSTYSCLYASTYSDWYGKSPNAVLIEISDDLAKVYAYTYQFSEPTDGEKYLLGIDKGENGKYFMTGEMSGYYGATVMDPENALEFTATAVTSNGADVTKYDTNDNEVIGYTLSATIDGVTKYVTMEKNDTHYNLVFSETAQTLTYNTDYDCFTIKTTKTVTDETDQTTSEEEYEVFLGTYGSYTTIGWYDASLLSNEGEYPLHLYQIVDTTPILGEAPYTLCTPSYWLGFEMSETNYYFDGTVYNTNYAGVTDDLGYAVDVKLSADNAEGVTNGYNLSFTEGENTYYLGITESGSYRNLTWSTTAYTWYYDVVFGAFVGKDSEESWYFIGTYGTYKDLCVNGYGYLTGAIAATNPQYVATLTVTHELSGSTTVNISAPSEVYAGFSVTLSASLDKDADKGVTWSLASGDCTYASIDASTGVLTGISAGSVTVTATATKANETSNCATGTATIVINGVPEGEVAITYDFTKIDTQSITAYTTETLQSALTSTMSAESVTSTGDGGGNNSITAIADTESLLTSSPFPVLATNNVYPGAGGSSGGLTEAVGCVKFGSSNYNGALTLDLSGFTATSLSVTAVKWAANDEAVLKLNDETTGKTISGVAPNLYAPTETDVYTWDCSSLSEASELKLAATKRVLVFSITLTGTFTASSSSGSGGS